MRMAVEGKSVLVTGASRGLGKALAEGFTSAHANVASCSLHAGNATRMIDSGFPPPTVLHRQCDVSSHEECLGFVEEVVSTFGRLDVLINNASILGLRAPIESYPPDVWENVIRVNLTGVFNMTSAVIPHMKKQMGGSIINVSSSVGRTGRKTWGAYAASKFGVEGLTQVLGEELHPWNIRVNSVNPGAMATEMRHAAFPNEDPSTLKKPEEILAIFYYLASEESKEVTGQTLDAQSFQHAGNIAC